MEYSLSDDERSLLETYARGWHEFDGLFRIRPELVKLDEATRIEETRPGTIWSLVSDFASTGSGSVNVTLEEAIQPGLIDGAQDFLVAEVAHDSEQGAKWNGLWLYTGIALLCRYCDGEGEDEDGDCRYCDGGQTVYFDLNLEKGTYENDELSFSTSPPSVS